jgi:tRNA(Arg) A34 adenosine deaminase TadA
MSKRNRPILVAHAYDRKGTLLSRASNSYTQTHPIQAKYAKRAGLEHSIYLHAEIACLLRAGTTPVYKLTVERYYANGSPALARPCPICQLALKDWGVKHVEYTK